MVACKKIHGGGSRRPKAVNKKKRALSADVYQTTC